MKEVGVALTLIFKQCWRREDREKNHSEVVRESAGKTRRGERCRSSDA